MFRSPCPLGLAALFLSLSFVSAKAVILYRTGNTGENTTAPTRSVRHDGWDYGGCEVDSSAPPSPRTFYSALHIGQADGSTLTFQNVNYTVVQGFYDPQSDLVTWRIAENLSTFAPLYSQKDEVVSGPSIAVVTFGRVSDKTRSAA